MNDTQYLKATGASDEQIKIADLERTNAELTAQRADLEKETHRHVTTIRELRAQLEALRECARDFGKYHHHIMGCKYQPEPYGCWSGEKQKVIKCTCGAATAEKRWREVGK